MVIWKNLLTMKLQTVRFGCFVE